MALPASGPISFSQINIEKRSASNQQVSLGRESVRLLAGTQTDVPRTGSVSVSNLRDKAWGIEFDVTAALEEAQRRVIDLTVADYANDTV